MSIRSIDHDIIIKILVICMTQQESNEFSRIVDLIMTEMIHPSKRPDERKVVLNDLDEFIGNTVLIKFGYSAMRTIMPRSKDLLNLTDAFPFPVFITDKPSLYDTCFNCSAQIPLYALERPFDNWRQVQVMAFTYHCRDVHILHNHLYEVPFP